MDEFMNLYHFEFIRRKNCSALDLANLLVKYDTLTNSEKFRVLRDLQFLADQQIQRDEYSACSMSQFNSLRRALMNYAK